MAEHKLSRRDESPETVRRVAVWTYDLLSNIYGDDEEVDREVVMGCIRSMYGHDMDTRDAAKRAMLDAIHSM